MDRIQQIMSEEREASMRHLDTLALPAAVREDIVSAWMAIQTAVNKWIAAENRAVDARVMPHAVLLMTDEMERVYARLAAEKLTPQWRQ